MIKTVMLYSIASALATGLGVLPLVFRRTPSARFVARGKALAAGLMIAASFGLLVEGYTHSPLLVALGSLIGLICIIGAHKFLDSRDSISIERLSQAHAIEAIMIVGIMTLHSFAEGIGMGVAFGGTVGTGAYISSAILLHNIPEGLAIALVLVPMGVSLRKAMFWSIVSSIPQPLIALPAFLFVEVFRPFLPLGLGIAAGAMIWMAMSELIPETLEELPGSQVGSIVTVAITVMLIFQYIIITVL